MEVIDRRPTDETVEVAGGNCVRADYTGNIMANGNIELKNVLAIPGLKMNLISVSRATIVGNFVLFANKWAIVFSPSGQVIAYARERDGQFILDNSADGNSRLIPNKTVDIGRRVLEKGKLLCLATVASDKTELWHRRLGHLNYRTLYHIQKIMWRRDWMEFR